MPRYMALYFGEIPGEQPHSVRHIKAGEEFDYDGKPGLWMQEVKANAPKPAEPEQQPDTLHGFAQREAKNQADQLAKLKGEYPEQAKRGPGRPPKSSYT